MRNLFKAGLLIAGMTAIMGAATASSAAPISHATWRHHHPRRVEVNHRLAIQNHRITRELHTGKISYAQARDLRAQDRGIRSQERFDASKDGSHITRGEDRRLNREENGVSKEIGK